VGRHRKLIVLVAAGAAITMGAACSSDKASTPTTAAPVTAAAGSATASMGCVNAIAATGITAQTTVGDAMAALNKALDAEPSDGEQSYYRALLAALDGNDPASPVGPLAADVPCSL
jgi:hypothetical protein